jgi:asparagine synthase (glutamine-hydrolysing)
VKFKDGSMKHLLRTAMRDVLPESVAGRTDKMGFPVPLSEWLADRGEVRDFVLDVFGSQRAATRDLIDNRAVARTLDREPRFGRRIWGLLSLELWQRAFHDRVAPFTGGAPGGGR